MITQAKPITKTFYLTMATMIIWISQPSQAQITRVEIDWEIQTLEPDDIAVSPQIALIMANRADLSGDYAEFRINPEYDEFLGGIRINTWRGPNELDESFYFPQSPLNRENDLIRFTTLAELDGNLTRYRLKNLRSNQWGQVDNSLLDSCRTVGNGVINYSINITMAESEIEYGHTQVKSVLVKEIRYYQENTLAMRNRTGYFLYRDGVRFVEPETDQEIIDQYIAFE